jgi:hypothetical protein
MIRTVAFIAVGHEWQASFESIALRRRRNRHQSRVDCPLAVNRIVTNENAAQDLRLRWPKPDPLTWLAHRAARNSATDPDSPNSFVVFAHAVESRSGVCRLHDCSPARVRGDG